MSATGIQNWLKALMLDPDLMTKAKSDLDATFRGFDLEESEREFLRSPMGKNLPEGIDPQAFITISCVRPQIIRSIITMPSTPPKPVIAFVPDSLKTLFSTLRSSRENLESKTSDDKGRIDQKVVAALGLVDTMFSKPNESVPAPTSRLLDQSDITIVGLGMRSVDQLTREAERALLNAKEVFLIDGSVGLSEYLESKGAKIIDLSSLYKEGKDRLETYREMVKKVIEGAIRNGPVAFGLYGHPTVFAFPPFVVKQVAETLGLSVSVIPGVSSLDCIFSELMIDPANDGMQMFEATDLLLRKRTLQTDVQTVIWQVGTLETGLYSRRSSSPDRYNRFLSYLMQFFPPLHPCTAIYCSDHPAIPSNILRFPLAKIGDFADQLHGGFTLYLPPVAPAPVLDTELLDLLESSEHLNRVTRD